jgi:predicted enzyme related to lactoylglutathione lyase
MDESFRTSADSSSRPEGIHPGAAMTETKARTKFSNPTPELPVADVERAQQYYKDVLGFDIAWLYPGKEIGCVTRNDVPIFFRKRNPPFEPVIHWVYAPDIDAQHDEYRALGAKIVEPLELKPWGLRQFTIEDLDGNRFYFHCD